MEVNPGEMNRAAVTLPLPLLFDAIREDLFLCAWNVFDLGKHARKQRGYSVMRSITSNPLMGANSGTLLI